MPKSSKKQVAQITKVEQVAKDARRWASEERTPPDAAGHPEGFDAEELIGESEYSTREAGEREAPKSRVPGGPSEREPLAAPADALGRRYLEDATESPGPEDLDPDPDARRDPAADPIRQTAPRRRS